MVRYNTNREILSVHSLLIFSCFILEYLKFPLLSFSYFSKLFHLFSEIFFYQVLWNPVSIPGEIIAFPKKLQKQWVSVFGQLCMSGISLHFHSEKEKHVKQFSSLWTHFLLVSYTTKLFTNNMHTDSYFKQKHVFAIHFKQNLGITSFLACLFPQPGPAVWPVSSTETIQCAHCVEPP